MSSLFDYEDITNNKLDIECIYKELNDIPVVYKPIYSQVWYDIFKKYFLNDNVSIEQKVCVYSTFIEIPLTWRLVFHAREYNGRNISIDNNHLATDVTNYHSLINRLLSTLIEVSESKMKRASVEKFYGSMSIYWSQLFSDVIDAFICTWEHHMSSKVLLNEPDIYIECWRTAYTREKLSNAQQYYDLYMGYVYQLLKNNGVVDI